MLRFHCFTGYMYVIFSNSSIRLCHCTENRWLSDPLKLPPSPFLKTETLSFSENILVYCDKFYITSDCGTAFYIFATLKIDSVGFSAKQLICLSFYCSEIFNHPVPLLSVMKGVKL